jgi:hypothetical protein
VRGVDGWARHPAWLTSVFKREKKVMKVYFLVEADIKNESLDIDDVKQALEDAGGTEDATLTAYRLTDQEFEGRIGKVIHRDKELLKIKTGILMWATVTK